MRTKFDREITAYRRHLTKRIIRQQLIKGINPWPPKHHEAKGILLCLK